MPRFLQAPSVLEVICRSPSLAALFTTGSSLFLIVFPATFRPPAHLFPCLYVNSQSYGVHLSRCSCYFGPIMQVLGPGPYTFSVIADPFCILKFFI